MKKTIGLVTGVLIWLFFWWLGGKEFPAERGADAVFFALELIVFGGAGLLIGLANQKISSRDTQDATKKRGESGS